MPNQSEFSKKNFIKIYNSLSGLDFLKVNGATWGKNYNIISIIGSQSSGKSTLLNHLFGTAFDVMRAAMRQQTTKGILKKKIKI